ncbi:HTH CenpB-type DNA-binding domain [Lasallia pustulata]|uniref:HTH CenpB-type DNA-binding domain n=1 Tax=Lasallia pustulata TaxID=136370 RepID=A0A1W5DAM1_9LECA|nr:HTH CenpB-type DNA-binding domain [Lasallia pustulata]
MVRNYIPKALRRVDFDDSNDHFAPLEQDKDTRIQQAYDYWLSTRDQEDPPSLHKVAESHNVAYSTLRDRKNGAISKKEANQAMQKLTPVEEDVIALWVTTLATWGSPPTHLQLVKMAYELLQKRGVYKELGEQWIARFLARHPELKSKYVNPIEKERILATDPAILQHYFELYKSTKEQYDIDDENEWNMDEKGVAMGVIGKTKVIIPKRDIPQYMAVCGNREWVTLIESIGLSGRSLKPWVIFKGKQHMKAWWDIFTTGHISVSENGWTDNDICFEWLKRCFEPETRPTTPEKWRLLLFDGHASHLTGRAIDFCLEHKIVCFCLPAHATHLVQPLDVGVFAVLAHWYKTLVRERSQFNLTYQITKVDFLELMQEARARAITKTNVIKAWEATGHKPFNPAIVLKQVPSSTTISGPSLLSSVSSSSQPPTMSTSKSRPITRARATSANRPVTRDGAALIPLSAATPANIIDVDKLITQAKLVGVQAESNYWQEAFVKLAKACGQNMALSTIQGQAIAEMVEASKQRVRKGKRSHETYGEARVMSKEEVERIEAERQDKRDAKKAKAWSSWQKANQHQENSLWKQFSSWTPDVHGGRIVTPPPPSPKKTTVAAQNRLFNSIAIPFFHGINPDIFTAQERLELTFSPTKKTPGKPLKPRNQRGRQVPKSKRAQETEEALVNGPQEAPKAPTKSTRGRVIKARVIWEPKR